MAGGEGCKGDSLQLPAACPSAGALHPPCCPPRPKAAKGWVIEPRPSLPPLPHTPPLPHPHPSVPAGGKEACKATNGWVIEPRSSYTLADGKTPAFNTSAFAGSSCETRVPVSLAPPPQNTTAHAALCWRLLLGALCCRLLLGDLAHEPPLPLPFQPSLTGSSCKT